MICKKCKAEIPEGCPFCVKCGTEVGSASTETPSRPQSPQPRAVASPPAQRQAQPQQRQATVQPPQKQTPPQKQAQPAPAMQLNAQMAAGEPTVRPSKPFSKQPPTPEKPVYLPKDKNAKKVKLLSFLIVLLLALVIILSVKLLGSCQHIFLAATCEKPQICEICGETRGETAEHKVVNWEVIKKATCIENGEQKGVCTACGKEVTSETETVNHIAGKWETVLSANENGHPKKVLRCVNCGETIDEQEITGEAVGATEITSATEANEGTTVSTTESTTAESSEITTAAESSEITTTETSGEAVSFGTEYSDAETTEETISQKY